MIETNLFNVFKALHEQNLANTDHTTLLLNCYTKLKDVKKLNEFIMVSLLFSLFFIIFRNFQFL